jgi:ribosomal protein L22
MSDETPENIEAPDDNAAEIAADHAAAAAAASVGGSDTETDATDAEAADVAPTESADTESPDAAILAEAEAAAAEAEQTEAEQTENDDEIDETAEISASVEDAPAPTTSQRTVPTRRRDRKRDPNEPKPVVRAQAKYVRSSARKARLVCDNFRGKSVEEARAILAVTPRHVARDWSKLLESAVANAEHNHELVGEDLIIKAVQADEGPTIKRFRPRAQGRATRIRKRTSHLTILLTPKD